MGSYSSLVIGGHGVYAVKNDIDPLLMSLFRPDDKEIIQSTVGEYAPDRVEDGTDETPVTIVRYCCLAGEMRDRLDLMGYSLTLTEQVFERGRNGELEKLGVVIQSMVDSGQDVVSAERERDALSRIKLADWMKGFRGIIDSDPRITDVLKRMSPEDMPFPMSYMFARPWTEFFGFPTYDTRIFLRAALEAVDRDVIVEQDLTDLVEGGSFETTDDLNLHADYLVTADFATTQRVVVLTEGPSDKRILESALLLRRRHLADYFSFIDFDELRVPGGAASVISFAKAFAGAGILNRVLAILDNDTAAKVAMRALRGIRLPNNVRVILLPDLPFLRSYPTLGPTGVSTFDVNGLAASLELYLGEDVLRDGNGELAPVQWRGFDESLKQYQGEVVNKATLHARFAEKVMKAAEPSATESPEDWDAMDAVLDAICGAFSHSIELDDIVN